MLIVAVVILAGAGFGIYLYNMKPVDTREEVADFEVTAQALVSEFTSDESAATKKYADRIISVTGAVGDLTVNDSLATVFLSSGDPISSVQCSFYSDEITSVKGIQRGQSVRIKGKCTGKLMDVVLNNCSLDESTKHK